MVGRLIPETGEIKLITLPTADARPYGIKVSSQGVPWLCYNGSNKLASINPDTMEVRNTRCPHRTREFAGSRSQATTWSGTPISRGASWAASIQNRRGEDMAVAERSTIGSLCDRRGERHHLVNESNQRPTRWSDSIPRPRNSRAGRSRRGWASSGT